MKQIDQFEMDLIAKRFAKGILILKSELTDEHAPRHIALGYHMRDGVWFLWVEDETRQFTSAWAAMAAFNKYLAAHGTP